MVVESLDPFVSNQSNHPMILEPIGRVHCTAAERHAVRRGGARARVEVFEPYWPALDQIEHNTHLILFGWFHQSVRETLKTRPRKVAPLAFERGVFASRSPDRPNPIALTIVPLMRREGCFLEVDHLDFMDGTPIVDIKPYVPGWDSVFCAAHRRRSHPNEQTDEVLLGFFERDLENHVGPSIAASREGRLAVRACQLCTRHLDCDPRDERLHVTLHRIDPLMDGLMGITGAALSNGRLSIDSTESIPSVRRIEFRMENKRFELEELEGTGFDELWRVVD
ncbi:MAG: tRNA (N6-threonylcarbamoyladenosine(37)-N6)-methyltransferase TrmO [Myxococcales bacterium]|jgi:tRNA-Thr(GGU) m(6)t(6)A37 methyltransferase TsaA|nr:tRNA (N6-threonylcarbamoyladenosine(37)-N6)-methyltransferase TrmO [Myxococcales bacterium]